MSRQGIDWAWGGPPSAASLRHANIGFVGRYFSYDQGKNIHAGEYKFLRSLGIDVIVAWETTATRARDGGMAGRSDALAAETQRAACGMPGSQPIHFAVDYEASISEIEPYFKSVHNAIGLTRTGAYGGYNVIKNLFDANLIHSGWQTYAWSAGQWDRRARYRQYSNGHFLGGVEVDYDVDIGAPSVPKSAPKPSNPLDVLYDPERRVVNSYLSYIKHPPFHRYGIKVSLEKMIYMRKNIYEAAVHGKLLNGKRVRSGWNINNRYARYELLKKYTSHKP